MKYACYTKFLAGLLITLLLGSCAIHKDFPYICLRWGCFAKQVGLPSGRAVKKQMEVNAKVRKRKRDAKRKKNGKPAAITKSNKNYKPEETVPEEPAVKKDSLKYTFATKGDENFLILVFKEAHPPGQDSLLIKYPEKGEEISEYEKARIKNYLIENEITSGDKVIIKEQKEYSQPELSGSNKVKDKLAEFLRSLGIAPKQIRFKE